MGYVEIGRVGEIEISMKEISTPSGSPVEVIATLSSVLKSGHSTPGDSIKTGRVTSISLNWNELTELAKTDYSDSTHTQLFLDALATEEIKEQFEKLSFAIDLEPQYILELELFDQVLTQIANVKCWDDAISQSRASLLYRLKEVTIHEERIQKINVVLKQLDLLENRPFWQRIGTIAKRVAQAIIAPEDPNEEVSVSQYRIF